MEKDKFENSKYKFAMWLIFFSINFIVAVQLKAMIIIPDEYNPAGIAASLAGYDWSVSISNYANYYGYGQAIFYTPLYYLIDNSKILYSSMIVLNCFFISFIPLIVYYIAKNFFSIQDNKKLILISLAVSTQPSYLALSKYTWNETFVMLMLWLVAYFLVKCYLTSEVKENKLNYLYSAGLAFTVMYGYTIHGRFLAIIASIFVTLIVSQFVFKIKLVNYKTFSIVFFVTYLVDKQIKSYFLRNVWLVKDASELRNTFSETLVRIFENFSLETVTMWLRAANGYIFYLTISSLGLLVLGIFLYIRLFRSRELKDDRKEDSVIFKFKIFGLFSLSSIVFETAVAILFFTTELHENIYYIYGRYTEYLLGLILLFVFVYIQKFSINKITVILSYCVVLLSCILTIVLEAETMATFDVVKINILTLISFAPNFSVSGSTFNFIFAVFVGAILSGIVALLILKKDLKVYLFTIIVFCTSYTFIYLGEILNSQKIVLSVVESTLDFFDNKHLDVKDDFKRVYLLRKHPVSYHLAMKDYIVYPNINERTEIEENSFIVVAGDFNVNCDYKHLYKLINEGYTNDTILVYGDDLYNSLLSQGYLFEDNGVKINFGNSPQEKCNYRFGDGWWEEEVWGSWSKEKNSIVYINVGELINTELELGVLMHSYGKDMNVEVYANGDYVTDILVSSTGERNYKVQIPKELNNSSELELEFKCIEEFISPNQAGSSEDKRQLGLALTNIGIIENSTKNGYRIGEGWWDQENWGYWSKQNISNAYINIGETTNRDLELNMLMNSYGKDLTVEVYANDEFIANLLVSSFEFRNYMIQIPKAVNTSSELKLEFKCIEDLMTPKEYDNINDDRKLGIALTNIVIDTE